MCKYRFELSVEICLHKPDDSHEVDFSHTQIFLEHYLDYVVPTFGSTPRIKSNVP